MRYLRFATLLTVGCELLAGAGCAQMRVTRVDPDHPDVRPDDHSRPLHGVLYSLPRVYVQVTPQADGSVDADFVVLPDPESTYVIEASNSFISSYTLNTSIANGLLTSVGWNTDTSAVAAAAVTSAGTVGQKVIDTEAAARTAQATAIAAAQKAVADADLEVELAQSHLQFAITHHATEDVILAARQALQDAVIKRDAARRALDALLGRANAGKQRGTADRPVSLPADAPSETPETPGVAPDAVTRMYGPALYVLNERVRGAMPTVELRAARPQDSFPSVTAPAPTTLPTIFPRGTATLSPDKDGRIILTVTSSSSLLDVQPDQTFIVPKGKPARPFQNVSLESPVTVRADLTSLASAAGEYTLDVHYTYGDPKKPLAGHFTVDVIIQKNTP